MLHILSSLNPGTGIDINAHTGFHAAKNSGDQQHTRSGADIQDAGIAPLINCTANQENKFNASDRQTRGRMMAGAKRRAGFNLNNHIFRFGAVVMSRGLQNNML